MTTSFTKCPTADEIEEMWGMGTPQDLQNFLQNFKF